MISCPNQHHAIATATATAAAVHTPELQLMLQLMLYDRHEEMQLELETVGFDTSPLRPTIVGLPAMAAATAAAAARTPECSESARMFVRAEVNVQRHQSWYSGVLSAAAAAVGFPSDANPSVHLVQFRSERNDVRRRFVPLSCMVSVPSQ